MTDGVEEPSYIGAMLVSHRRLVPASAAASLALLIFVGAAVGDYRLRVRVGAAVPNAMNVGVGLFIIAE